MDCGGAQTHVLELALGLCRLGHEVCVASAGGALVPSLNAGGVRHEIVTAERKNAVSLIRLGRELKALICKGFDVVHAHTRISAMLAESICRAKDICFVSTVHAHFKMNALLRRACRWGEAQIAVSRDLYFYLLENSTRVSSDGICVINNGIDTRKFSPQKLNGYSKKPRKNVINVLFLSRLDKSCSSLAYSLCAIAPKLWRECPEIRIIIGGGGSELERVRQLADEVEKSLGTRVVEAVGRVDDALEFLSKGDIFIGASRAALEAMACGIPTIVGGDEGFLGVADGQALQRGEYSNFCCRGERAASDGELCDIILRLAFASEEERRAIGERAREYVQKMHSAENMAKKTAEFYQSALGRAGRKNCAGEKDRAGRKDRAEWKDRADRKGGGALICGYYGFGNMGDELMLRSALERAEREGIGPIQVLSRPRTEKFYLRGVRLVNRASPTAVIRAIRRADTVIFGGGTLLQDRTSRRSLAYYLAILRFAQLCGKRTELWGNGIGAIRGRVFRRAVAGALCACDKVGVRDGASMERARRMADEFGFDISNALAESDLAFEPWLYDADALRESDALVRLGLSERQRIAVFAVMGKASQKQRSGFWEYAKKLSDSGHMPIFVVMYPAQDLALSRRYCKMLGGKLAYPFGAEDIVALMRRAEVVCSMRYHALLLACVAGTRFVGFGDDDKIKSFCDTFGGSYYEPSAADEKSRRRA